MMKNLLSLCVLMLSFSITAHLPAQPNNNSEKTDTRSEKPFRILTSGKRITIQSKQNLKTIIVWTSDGHRIVEQKDINAPAYTFEITINEKIFFARIDLGNGKMYTEKIGVR